MQISKQQIIAEARVHNYKPEILEKVYCLLDIFKQLMSVKYLRERLVLKGGTAINLFYFEVLPRLSVDIDLNYIGSLDREQMLQDRPILIDAIHKILIQNRLEIDRSLKQYAGGKMIFFYNSIFGQRGSLEIDVNFMYRQPLYPIIYKHCNIKPYRDWQAPMLNIYEITAGKLCALFNRNASRDFFDAHQLLTKYDFDISKLKTVLIPYLVMTNVSLDKLEPSKITYSFQDIKNKLLPVLQQNLTIRKTNILKNWADSMLHELQSELSRIIPLASNEIEFIELIRNERIIKPELITDDIRLNLTIKTHPAIIWAAKDKFSTHITA